MGRRASRLTRVTVAVAVAGALSVAGTGVVAAAAPAATPTASTATPGVNSPLTPSQERRPARFSCTRADRALSRITRAEAALSAGLPRLHEAETKASTRGDTRRATRIGARIARLERPEVAARLRALATAIETKCGVDVPAAGSSEGG